MGPMIKSFLDDCSRENKLQDEIKEIRQSKKSKSTSVISIMSDRNLNVVRVVSHKDGPRDIILQRKHKRQSLTPKLLRSLLESCAGETIQEQTIDKILNQIKKPPEDSAEILSLQVKKLKTEETEPTVLAE